MNACARLAAVGLERPDYGGHELGAVLSACLNAVGAAQAVVGRDSAADRALLGIDQASHIVVVMLDGMGQVQLEARRGHAPFLRRAVAGSLTAGFPTTTATSLSLFGTGQAAGRTGMTGYTARNPRTGTLANLISWEGAYDAHEWQTEPSLLEQAELAGMRITALGKPGFAGSGLTQAALRGGEFVGLRTLAERVDVALERARHPGLTYLYWGEIDAAGHAHGWQSDQWVAALEDADRELERLARGLPAGATMVATADHGVVDVIGASRWDVADSAALSEGVITVAGEPRALHLYVADGASDAVVERWSNTLGDHAAVMSRADAIAAGLFGPVSDAVTSRIGEVIVAMADRAITVDSRTQSARSLLLVGMHGSLTQQELRVPLLVAAGGA